jgi:sugar phosphate isomerase/epimerase
VFRIGSTSYVIPDHIVPNVEFLAPRVDDVQLVLFETDEYGSNLPSAGEVQRLNELAAVYDLTYTVHLPLDLRLGDGGSEGHVSLTKARRVIQATRALRPRAFTLHLDGRRLVEAATAEERLAWRRASARALQLVAEWVEHPSLLSIENLEAWDPEAFAPLLLELPVSRTIDVGHFWLNAVDPLPHLRQWIHRAGVVHLHGVSERDHASLSHVPRTELDRVTQFLVEHFSGVVTLEVFSLQDFESSLTRLRDSMNRAMGVPA